jgi:hypothetical protein
LNYSWAGESEAPYHVSNLDGQLGKELKAILGEIGLEDGTIDVRAFLAWRCFDVSESELLAQGWEAGAGGRGSWVGEFRTRDWRRHRSENESENNSRDEIAIVRAIDVQLRLLENQRKEGGKKERREKFIPKQNLKSESKRLESEVVNSSLIRYDSLENPQLLRFIRWAAYGKNERASKDIQRLLLEQVGTL